MPTVASLISRAEARFGDRVAIKDSSGEEITFRALAAAARRAAKSFIALRVQPQDAVAIWAPNCWEWVAAAIGAQSVGAILVPLNTRLKGREVAEMLRRTKASVLISAGKFLGIDYPAQLANEALPALRRTVVIGETDAAGIIAWAEFLEIGGDISEEERTSRADAVKSTDIADIIFTSGTTGLPKGALFTYEATIRGGQAQVDNTGMSPQDRYLVFGPFSHTAGYKAGWISCLISGCTIFATSNYDPQALLKLIHHDRVTIMPSPPTVWQAILTHPNLRDFDLSSLRAVSSGGTVVPVELIRRLRKDLGVGLVATGYGMTECCGSATVSAPDDDLETIANTVGRPIPGTEMCTIRTDGTNCSVDEPGEILIRDRKLLLGYLYDPEATAAAFTADGWFKTGDVGVFDERGYLKLTGRLKDMFIVGGFNVYSAEVENVLGGMPGIMHVSVIGVPDARLGEVGQAFIVPAPGVKLSEEQVTAYARESMANYKVPRSVKFLSELPLNASGKVQKSLLRTLV